MRWIPLEEVMEKHINKPGFAEGCEQAQREFDEDIAIYGTIGNPKSPLPHFGKGGKDYPRPMFRGVFVAPPHSASERGLRYHVAGGDSTT